MATESTIDYEALQQDAMRGVVRAALVQITKTGLPGEHHFYISFLTQSPGVILSKRLREKYPHEMTIVLQHRFWDLLVSDERFEVKLTFDGIPERLVIPFASIKVFIDPSVRFGLQFEENAGDKETPAGRRATMTMTMDAVYDQVGEAQADSPRATLSKKPRSPRKVKADKEQAEVGLSAADAKSTVPAPQPASAIPAAAAASNSADGEIDKAAGDKSGAQILSLDQFRKK